MAERFTPLMQIGLVEDIGLEGGTTIGQRTTEKLLNSLRPEHFALAKKLLALEAKRAFGLELVDPSSRNETALAVTFSPPKPGEAVDWTKPLYDSDGYAHQLIDLGALQVVTKVSFAYAVWDRRSGQCVSHAESDRVLSIGNAPLSDAEREARQRKVLEVLRESGDASVQALADRVRPRGC